jgi:hypothetical protein
LPFSKLSRNNLESAHQDNFERALLLRNAPHLPTTQCAACAKFEDFAKQRNGGGGREKDLYRPIFGF